jgi:hypothetical protein
MIQYIRKYSLQSLLLLLIFTPCLVLGQGLLPADGSFENGLGAFKLESCCTHSFKPVRDVTRNGRYGVRFELNRTDSDVAGSKRVEVKTAFPFSQDMWFNLNYMFPTNYSSEYSPEIVTQWHDLPDKGEPWQAPSLYVWVSNNRLYLTNRWQFAKIGNNIFDGQNQYDLGAVKLDRWTNIVVHVRWALDSTGRIELWRDGVQQVYQKGPNHFNDDRFPYLKFGIYKYHWKTTPTASSLNKRVVYMDDIRIGDLKSNYLEVSTLGMPFLIDGFTSLTDTFQVVAGGWQRRQGSYELTAPVLQGRSIFANLTLHPQIVPSTFNLRVDAKVSPSTTKEGNLAVLFNYKDNLNYSYVSFSETGHSSLNGLYTVVNGVRRTWIRFPNYIKGGRSYHIEVRQLNNLIEVWLDNTLVGSASGAMATSGRMGFSSYNDNVSFDNLGIYAMPKW